MQAMQMAEFSWRMINDNLLICFAICSANKQ